MQNRVLLVEDDEELRELLSRYLTNQGFTAFCQSDLAPFAQDQRLTNQLL